MAGLSGIRSIFSYNLEVYNFKILFRPSFNFQEADYNLLNKYIIYKVNQYQAINIKNYGF